MFYALAGAIALLTALVLILPFVRSNVKAATRAEHDVEAYRAQLTEIEQDLLRSVLTETEAEAARTEVSRRLLNAADRAGTETAADALPQRGKTAITLATAIGTPLFAAFLYALIGEPGRPDEPLAYRAEVAAQLAQRPAQEQAEAVIAEERADTPSQSLSAEAQRFAELIDKVKEKLAETPDDTRGRLLLARSLSRVERHEESWREYAKLITTNPDQPAEIFAEMAESMMQATQGYISPEAESAIDLGLQRDTADARLRHFKAMALAQRGELEQAHSRWVALLDDAPAGAPWAPMVYERTAEAALELGIAPPKPPKSAPATVRGPDAEQIEAASGMSPEDRQSMIEGMVDGLAARLEEDPGVVAEWVQLIRAYTVMGRIEERDAAIKAAMEAHKDDSVALQQIQEAAR